MPQFMLLLRDCGHFYNRTPAEMEQIVQEFTAWARNLQAEKRLVDANPFANTGRIVTAEGDRIVDSPFEGGDNMIGGFFLIEVDDYDQATTVARECPGLKWGESVEVRAIGH